jgi:hypothetical protein
MKQHRRSDSDRISLDRGDDRDRVASKRTEQPPDGNVVGVPRQRAHEVVEVVAGGKVPSFPADSNHPDRIVARSRFHRVGECRVHGDRDCIAPVWPRKRDCEHFAVPVDSNISHVSPLFESDDCLSSSRYPARNYREEP